jgi:hypothetical protein
MSEPERTINVTVIVNEKESSPQPRKPLSFIQDIVKYIVYIFTGR